MSLDNESSEFLDTNEVAALLGISRQRLDQIRNDRRVTFPAPWRDRPYGRLWRRADIEEYGRIRNTRPGPAAAVRVPSG